MEAIFGAPCMVFITSDDVIYRAVYTQLYKLLLVIRLVFVSVVVTANSKWLQIFSFF